MTTRITIHINVDETEVNEIIEALLMSNMVGGPIDFPDALAAGTLAGVETE